MNMKLISQKPHKKYVASVTDAKQVKDLCKFLRNQKDKQLEIVINGNSTKFNSIVGRKRFAAGFESAFKLVVDKNKSSIKTLSNRCISLMNNLKVETQRAKTAERNLNEEAKKYMVRYEVMKIRKAAWEDYIVELEDDRSILKEELDRLRKPILTRKKINQTKKRKKK